MATPESKSTNTPGAGDAGKDAPKAQSGGSQSGTTTGGQASGGQASGGQASGGKTTPAPADASKSGEAAKTSVASGASTAGASTAGASTAGIAPSGGTPRQAGGDGLPSAGTEPSTQAAQHTASPLSLDPADYEMPDEYAESWFDRARTWAEQNPLLAIAAAAGVGLVVGRVVMGLVPEPEPKTLKGKVQKQARTFSKDARHLYGEASKDAKKLYGEASKDAKKLYKRASKDAQHLGKEIRSSDSYETLSEAYEALSKQVERLTEHVQDLAERAPGAAERVVDKTKDLAEVVAEAASAAVSGVVSKKTDNWLKKLRN
ncbi:MAG: hypothetical protein ACK41D_04350 [Rubricoccaceae bacterium]